jgi:hypothetical protein
MGGVCGFTPYLDGRMKEARGDSTSFGSVKMKIPSGRKLQSMAITDILI